MRRALLEQLPALTKFYGLRPEDVERMTLREVLVYQRQMAEYHAEMARDRG